MVVTFEVPGRLDGLNEITSENRSNRFQGSRGKKRNQRIVEAAIMAAGIKPFGKPVSGTVLIVRSDRRHDRDTLEAGAKKVILDAMKACGVIKNDGWNNALEFPARCIYGANERVVVTITDEERMTDYIPCWTQDDSDRWEFPK